MIADLIYSSMLEYKNFVAIKNKNVEKTYYQLNNTALAIANILYKENIIKKNIAILGDRNLAVYYGILASVYSSNTYVPINKKYPTKKINEILKSSNIKTVILSVEDLDFFSKNIAMEDNNIKLLIVPDGESGQNIDLNIDCYFGLNTDERIDKPLAINQNSNLYIMFTSGSTGKPKGVEVTHNNVNSFLFNMSKFYGLNPGYRASQSFDLSFDLSVSDVFFTWMNGGTLVILPPEELFCPSEYIKREKINFWFSVPTLAQFMKNLGFLKSNDFPTLKYSLFCGEPLLLDTATSWSNAAKNSTVENLYGPTETTISITRFVYGENSEDENFNNGIVPIGNIFPDQKMKIIDEKEKVVEKGKKGELIISGSQVAKGYLNDKDNTEKFFKSMPWDNTSVWYKTGDIVFINERNELEYVRRKDNQIKIGGRRIEIGEIENALNNYHKKYSFVVIPYNSSENIIEFLVAFTLSELTKLEIDEMKLALSNQIEDIFFPKHFIKLDKIPLTTSGKTDRKILERSVIKYIK